MKQNKKSNIFKMLFSVLVAWFFYTLDWGGGYLLSKIPTGFSKGENLKLQGNPLKGFSLSGSISFENFEFLFTEPTSISDSFFRIPESIAVANCLIKSNTDFLDLKMPQAFFIAPKLLMSNTCKIQITLSEDSKNQLQADYLEARVSGEWDLLGENGYMKIEMNLKESIHASFEKSHAVGIKAQINKQSKWWSIFGFYPGLGDLNVDWERGTGSFVLDNLSLSQSQDIKVMGSINQDGDWSAIIPLQPGGLVGLKSDNNDLSGSWEGVEWRGFFGSLSPLLDVFLGAEGIFLLQEGLLTVTPGEGEYFHEIQLSELPSGILANKNTKNFEFFSWDLGEGGVVSVDFENFSWLLSKPANWWPRGIFDGFLKIDPKDGTRGEVRITGPASMQLMNEDSQLDLFEIDFQEVQKEAYRGDSLLLRLSDPELVLLAEDFYFSEEKGILAKGKVATTSSSIVKFFGQEVIGLISLFAGPDHESQIFQIPVEISGTTKDPKISMSGMPLRWELCPSLTMLDCLEKRAKQSPN